MLAAAVAVAAVPGLAHDLPPVVVPDGPVTVLHKLWPERIRAGEGHVRLAPHPGNGTAVRLDANQTFALEREYGRQLAHLMMRMPLHRARPIAYHRALHAIVGDIDRNDAAYALRPGGFPR
ncbi:hypothetical protein [Jannaschia sp. LMIT008]|uniref:hypothetical protein n=1 Tax=Jannaschia maritima TaxID=3032585 RepID=UPI002811D4CC|nr:hypothetical protein [Jannaschia sp. LMIT008]